MPRCAFLTLEDRTGFCIYDQLLFEPLAAVGWEVEEVPWTAHIESWSEFDAVVVRSTWDYQNDPDLFLAVLDRIESQTRLFNSAKTCRWNLDKIYLQELKSLGVPTIPTVWGTTLEPETIAEAMRRFSARQLIVKPRVGANADSTYVLSSADTKSRQAALKVFSQQPFLLQPFLPSVVESGEYSLFYFASELSHAILKRPAAGDFRVQEEHGGRISPTRAPADVHRAAKLAIEALGECLLYARVDIVRLPSGEPALMELELIEPSLYFEQCKEAPENFVRAFLASI